MLSECLLDVLGDYFVAQQLEKQGWEFHEFVGAWQQGYIEFEQK